MRITLKQKDIEAGLRLYLMGAGIGLVGKAVTVKFTAGRTEEGLTASVDIEDEVAQPITQVGTGTGPIGTNATNVTELKDAKPKATAKAEKGASAPATKEDAPPAPPPAPLAEAGESTAEAGTVVKPASLFG